MKAWTAKNDMEEAGGRECEESRVEDLGSCRSNKMEGKYKSHCEGDEVYSATFGDEKKTGLKLDDDDDLLILSNLASQNSFQVN